jgi:hypothetical protein
MWLISVVEFSAGIPEVDQTSRPKELNNAWESEVLIVGDMINITYELCQAVSTS